MFNQGATVLVASQSRCPLGKLDSGLCGDQGEGLDPHGLGMDEPDAVWVATAHHGRGGREAHVK